MKRLIVVLGLTVLLTTLTSCGSSGGGDGSSGSFSSSTDIYVRYGGYIGNTYNMTQDNYNPVVDVNTGSLFRPGSTVILEVMANNTATSAFIATVVSGSLRAGYLNMPALLNLKPIGEVVEELFGGGCNVDNTAQASLIEYYTKDDGIYIYKAGYNGDTDIFYEHIYVDKDVSIVCDIQSGGYGININMTLQSGWNEIRYSNQNITSITASEEFWLADY